MGSRVCHYHRFFVKRRIRSFGSSAINPLLNCSLTDDQDSSGVLVERNASSRTVTLNRPSSLNALNAPMMKKLHKLYESWEDNPNVGFVVMKGNNGKAFSAGGDIVAMRDMITKGNIEGAKEIFRTAYKFIYLVHTYLKPNVAILDGITMGGGAGVAIPGKFRIVTDKTVFATPETLIGLHPDGGASFYLSRLPGYLGEYLGLTGDRLNGAEMMACGLATHYLHSTNVRLLEEHLKNLVVDDPYVIETFLQKCTDFVYPENNSVLKRMELVNRCFSHDTIEDIIDALESEAARTQDGWCFSVLKKLKYASPLSLKVSLRSIREGRFQTLDQCLVREYQMTLQGISGQISNDFCEGVRARMKDKDFAPKWDPPRLKDISQDMVDWYFSPLNALEPGLEFPTKRCNRHFHKYKTNLMEDRSKKDIRESL